MRFPSIPPELQPDSDAIQKIQLGAVTERGIKRRLTDWSTLLARTEYAIPAMAVSDLVERALDATINTIRNGSEWRPGLVKQMLKDQAFVYNLQHRVAGQDLTRRLNDCAVRYVRMHVGKWLPGKHLTRLQEEICQKAVDTFYDKLLDSRFELTSSLTSFLIGIIKVGINEALRLNELGIVGLSMSRQTENQHVTDYPMLLPVETVLFYQEAHNLITSVLGQLKDNCQKIIMAHYGLNPERLRPLTDQPTALSEADFQARFDLAMSPASKMPSLKELAPELNISPKKISDRHLNCVDQVVRSVMPGLLGNEELAIPADVEEALQNRLAIARRRANR